MQAELNVIERGEGRPIVLLHGIGSAAAAWEPVAERLASERRVLAYDLPGFASSPPLPEHVTPAPLALGEAVMADLGRRGIEGPIDMAGNSLGGRIALELAKRGDARSVTALSPGGLWRDEMPRLPRLLLRSNRLLARRLPGPSKLVMRSGLGRTLALGTLMSARGSRVPYEVAVRAVTDIARAGAFDEVLDASGEPFRGGGAITVPVTIAWGDKDRLLTARSGSQYRGELPPHARWHVLRGAGHVPMFDQPDEIARLILETAA